MDRYIVYFAGGTMTGVFGAGVATALQKHNIYSKLNAVYATSAGVMTGAYFLARQTELGATIYWEDLQDNFISKKDFFVGVWQRFQDEFIKSVPAHKLKDALDIDYAMEIVKNRKRLDTARVLAQEIPLDIKFFNLDTHKIEYIDARRSDIFSLLKMGINVFPYVHELIKIDGIRYIDAGIIDNIGINQLLAAHPQERIIVVLNRSIHSSRYYKIKNVLEGKFMQWMFDDQLLYHLHASAESRLQQDLEIIRENPRVILIAPQEKLLQSRTTSSELLFRAYNAGVLAGEETLKKL